nr:NifB/NifX family molybdenum-iron cluster-binding protein [uncultured Holophaga sp.]
MKIALPTMDGQTISEHFGRCKAFLVYEIEGGLIRGSETRTNAQGGEDAPECGTSGHGHNHGAFAELLSDCEAVIVKGMGGGAVKAIARAGLRIYRANASATPEEAIFRMLQGRLEVVSEGSCAGH